METSVLSEDCRTLSKQIQEIANLYFHALTILKTRCGQREKIKNQKLVDKVKSAFYKLDCLEREFINKEFFYDDYPRWWEKAYSKTTYYRIKRRSMKNFKEAYEYEN